MKNTILFGAGQAGAMALKLLSGEYVPVCFADNSLEKQKTVHCGFPVLPLSEALKTEPDCVCICALDDVRTFQMEKQLDDLGFNGDIFYARSLLNFDIRAATMRLIADEIKKNGISGDIAELGVYKGDFAELINLAFPERRLHLFDTFSGFPEMTPLKTEAWASRRLSPAISPTQGKRSYLTACHTQTTLLSIRDIFPRHFQLV